MQIISDIYTLFCSFVSVLYVSIFHNEKKNILSNTEVIVIILCSLHYYYATFTLHFILNVHTWDTEFYSSLSSFNLFEMPSVGNIHIGTPNMIYYFSIHFWLRRLSFGFGIMTDKKQISYIFSDQKLTSQVHEIVGRINGRFGTLTTVPIHHLVRS